MATEFTHVQIATARKLARAFGHGWACETPADHPIPGARWTATLIEELYLAVARRDGYEPWQYGISAPRVVGLDCIRHTTGTGRTTWCVYPDGKVGVTISRPGDVVVLSVRIDDRGVRIRTPETRDNQIPDVPDLRWSPEGGPRAESRHGNELLGLLTILCGTGVASVAIIAAGVPLSPPPGTAVEAIETRVRAAGAAAEAAQLAECAADGCTADRCGDRAREDAERDMHAHLTRG